MLITFGALVSVWGLYSFMNVPIPPGPPFFRFSDSEESKRVLTAAGFVNVRVTRVPQVWRLPSPDARQVTVSGRAVEGVTYEMVRRMGEMFGEDWSAAPES